MKLLTCKGYLIEEQGMTYLGDTDPEAALTPLQAAACTYRIAFGPRAGESAIVLDDPVSSLDHDHREYLARRPVHEAKKRQVVIYTHDLTFSTRPATTARSSASCCSRATVG